jgi:hypothetical protein
VPRVEETPFGDHGIAGYLHHPLRIKMWHDARYMNPCGVEMDGRVVTSDGKASLSIVTVRREDGTAFLHAHQQWFPGQTGLGDPGHYDEGGSRQGSLGAFYATVS